MTMIPRLNLVSVTPDAEKHMAYVARVAVTLRIKTMISLLGY